jgi:hypothetical protein
MFSRLREHFGTAGLVVAIVALIAALGGGAYAASGGSSGGKATASAKGKQGPRGKTGKTGPAGPQGPPGLAGPAGPTGPAGAKGDAGTAGSNGTNGTNGTSATTESFNGALHGCTEGGVVVKSASPEAIVCNGKKGTDGTTGFTEFLPAGKTETGVWRIVSNGEEEQYVPISFPIPLSESATEETEVHVWREDAVSNPAECSGTPDEPKAALGSLCIYIAIGEEASGTNVPFVLPQVIPPSFTFAGNGVGQSGAFLYFSTLTQAGKHVSGAFAITAAS